MADMNHIHHKLLRLGFPQKKATAIILLTNFLLVCLVYILQNLDLHILLGLILAIELLLTLMVDRILNYRSEKSEEVF